MELKKAYKNKKLIVFDMDGTLTPSKAPMDKDMVNLFTELLKAKPVAVIGGGKYGLFQEQMLTKLDSAKGHLTNLYVFPTCSTVHYRFKDSNWTKVYAKELSPETRKKIFSAFEKVFEDLGYQHPEKTYGPIIEDRHTQVTFSALGQDIVAVLGPEKGIALKKEWGQSPWRGKIAKRLREYLPDLEVREGGLTSIDVTQKGIDKAYGLKEIQKYLNIKIKDMLFIGDAIYPGGNDYAAVRTGVDYIKVSGPEDTKKIIQFLLE